MVLLKVLAGEVNKGYHGTKNFIVAEVDGTPVKSLSHLVELVEGGEGEYVEFRSKYQRILVLHRQRALTETAKILQVYRINEDRSEDLR